MSKRLQKDQKLIVIDGTDGCGKATQAGMLEESLKEAGFNVKHIAFPRYEDQASLLVKRYLEGKYGEDPESVNPYAASILYAVDRFDAFSNEDNDYEIVIADRYTTSNMIHQASKIEDKKEREDYLSWLEDLEYKKMGIPEPDLTIFLDLPVKYSNKLIRKREEAEHTKADIHEKNKEYLSKSYETAKELAEQKGWSKINCLENGELRSKEDIHEEILKMALDILE